MNLSTNFPISEYTKSMTAIRKGIDNSMSDKHLISAKALFKHIVQPVRDQFGITNISSGYRSPKLNRAIGGSARSQHSKAEAADFECQHASTIQVAEWIADNLDFDQLILEFYTPGDPSSGWVHCSYKSTAKNRNQILTAVKEDGKTVYKSGFVT